jgi:hypothetical protein
MKTVSPKALLGAAAAVLALGAGAPVMASGGGYVSAHYSSGYYGGGYHAAGYKSYRHRGHHRHRRGHHHRGGGKGAAIALGVIGGAIILNELAEDRANDRYYRDRYYRDRYYDGYYDGRRDARSAEYYGRTDDARRYDDEYDDEDDRYEYDAYEDDHESDYEDDALDDRLEGGAVAPARITVDAAYDACLRHARNALGERGFVVSAPYQPETAVDRGGAWLMTATVTAQRGPDRWSRAMSCEASDNRVFRLELI